MNLLITILARRGSKGLPNKHTRSIAGRPLIWWTLHQALAWRGDRIEIPIVISSDDSEIHLGAGHSGAPTVRHYHRSAKYATDTTPKVPAIREATEWAEEVLNRDFSMILDLDATAPLRYSGDIDEALRVYGRSDCDCVLSCTVGVGRNPYFNLLKLSVLSFDAGCGVGLERFKASDRGKPIHCRQDAPQVYEANSSIYVYSRDFLMREDVNSPLDGICVPTVMPDESFYHIDSELDFFVVEKLMERRQANAE